MTTDPGIFLVPGEAGRDIEVLTGGDPDGFPLLYHSGSPSAVARSPQMDQALADQGLRLVTYSRPGYGASTPRPAPGQFADDIAETQVVLDHFGITDFVTMGWSGGGPRALACAALLPGRCRAAASLAGVAPADAPDLDWSAGMAEENQAEYQAAAAGADAYEAYLTENLLPFFQTSAAELSEAMGGLVTPVDKAALTGDMAEVLSRSFQNAGAQGVRGARDDGLAAFAPWGFDLATITVPVAIWQGGQDAMVPYAHGEWLVRHVPGAEAHLLPEHGHLSLMQVLPEILSDLKRLAGV